MTLRLQAEPAIQEAIMQMAMTSLAVVGGFLFSLAIALLSEEIIFGQIFRLFFTPSKLAKKEPLARTPTGNPFAKD
jgi:hypothetical protein